MQTKGSHNQSLENLLKDLSNLVKNYFDVINNYDLILNYRDRNESEQQIFVSELGIDLNDQFKKLNSFWAKLLSPGDLLSSVEKGYNALKTIIKTKNDTNNNHEEKSSDNENDTSQKDKTHDYTLSMSVLMISGLIDDYLSAMKEQVFDIMYQRGDKKEGLHLIENFRTSRIKKINLLIKAMDKEKQLQFLLRKENLNPWKEKFEKFNKIRNRLAHSGYMIDSGQYESDSDIIIDYVRGSIKTKDGRDFNDKLKNILMSMAENQLSLLSKLAIISVDAFVYLSILDRLFLFWKNNLIEDASQ